MIPTKASTFRRALNLWPPFLCTGIAVQRVSPDFREIDVCLRSFVFNRNPNGSHFGGSLFSMTDPFYALMLAHILGRGYTIWDRHSTIDFRTPGRGTVTAHFRLDEATIDAVREAAEGGGKVLRDFSVDIVDASGAIVAAVGKTVYIRKKRRPA